VCLKPLSHLSNLGPNRDAKPRFKGGHFARIPKRGKRIRRKLITSVITSAKLCLADLDKDKRFLAQHLELAGRKMSVGDALKTPLNAARGDCHASTPRTMAVRELRAPQRSVHLTQTRNDRSQTARLVMPTGAAQIVTGSHCAWLFTPG